MMLHHFKEVANSWGDGSVGESALCASMGIRAHGQSVSFGGTGIGQLTGQPA